MQKKVLTPNGKYVTVDGQGTAKKHTEELIFLKELLEMGKIKSVIETRYPLEKFPEAHWYAEKGHKKGNEIITLIQNDKT